MTALSSRGDAIPGPTKLTNVARQGFSGHHYVVMALCSVVASFLVNALFAFATKPRGTLSPAQLAVAGKITITDDHRNFEQSGVAYARARAWVSTVAGPLSVKSNSSSTSLCLSALYQFGGRIDPAPNLNSLLSALWQSP